MWFVLRKDLVLFRALTMTETKVASGREAGVRAEGAERLVELWRRGEGVDMLGVYVGACLDSGWRYWGGSQEFERDRRCHHHHCRRC